MLLLLKMELLIKVFIRLIIYLDVVCLLSILWKIQNITTILLQHRESMLQLSTPNGNLSCLSFPVIVTLIVS